MSLQSPAATSALGVPDVYADGVDINQALSSEQREIYKQNSLTSFSPALAVVLSLITGGLFSTIFYQLKHDQLPKVKQDDPSAGKAIGFMFIPLFNIYWQFFAWRRLADRINLQYRLRGKPEPISRGQVTALIVLALVGWIPALLGWVAALVLWIMLILNTQNAINELAAEHGA
jgi:hypothetical protein